MNSLPKMLARSQTLIDTSIGAYFPSHGSQAMRIYSPIRCPSCEAMMLMTRNWSWCQTCGYRQGCYQKGGTYKAYLAFRSYGHKSSPHKEKNHAAQNSTNQSPKNRS
jgi:hypothetical protein